MKRSQDYLSGYADGLELGYKLGHHIGTVGRAPVDDLARPALQLVHSQPAASCTRSRRTRPHLKVVA